MIYLRQDLRKELARDIVDFWMTSPDKCIEMIELIQEHGTFNATAVLMEEVCCMSNGLVDKTWYTLLNSLFSPIHEVICEEFEYFIRTGEVGHVRNV